MDQIRNTLAKNAPVQSQRKKSKPGKLLIGYGVGSTPKEVDESEIRPRIIFRTRF